MSTTIRGPAHAAAQTQFLDVVTRDEATARFRAHLAAVERVMGGLLVLTGIAFLTGFISQASYWLLEAFPVLGQIG